MVQDLVKIERALISVFDKTDLIKLVGDLVVINPKLEIISSGGTAKTIRASNYPAVDVSDYTGFPESPEGLVKTLHPKVHGGFLMDPTIEEHRKYMEQNKIEPINLVVINLYPFEEVVRKGADIEKSREMIDIGGPAMLRAAAKNFKRVAVLVDPKDYPAVIDEMKRSNGCLSLNTRFYLAKKAFNKTSGYDYAINTHLSGISDITNFYSKKPEETKEKTTLKSMYRTAVKSNHPDKLNLTLHYGGASNNFLEKILPPFLYGFIVRLTGGCLKTVRFRPASFNLRYGTNPNQPASIYIPDTCNFEIEQLKTGKGGISVTNIEDAFRAANFLKYINKGKACAVMKHANPSGAAVSSTQNESFRKAWLSDWIAAFGGVVCFNTSLEKETATEMIATDINNKPKYFIEVVAAPAFDDGAIEVLEKRTNIRIVQYKGIDKLPRYEGDQFTPWMRPIAGSDGMLVLEDPFMSAYRTPEDLLKGHPEKSGTGVVTEREPTEQELSDMLFGIRLAHALRSNGIAVVKSRTTRSLGTGQQDRIRAVRQAIYRADELHQEAIKSGIERGDYGLGGSVLASDGFFPFPDSIEACGEAGITAIVQPGGSERDQDIIAAANRHNIAMILTGERYFSHH